MKNFQFFKAVVLIAEIIVYDGLKIIETPRNINIAKKKIARERL